MIGRWHCGAMAKHEYYLEVRNLAHERSGCSFVCGVQTSTRPDAQATHPCEVETECSFQLAAAMMKNSTAIVQCTAWADRRMSIYLVCRSFLPHRLDLAVQQGQAENCHDKMDRTCDSGLYGSDCNGGNGRLPSASRRHTQRGLAPMAARKPSFARYQPTQQGVVDTQQQAALALPLSLCAAFSEENKVSFSA